MFLQPYWRARERWLAEFYQLYQYDTSFRWELRWNRESARKFGAKETPKNNNKFLHKPKILCTIVTKYNEWAKTGRSVWSRESEKFKDSIRFNWENYIYCRSRVLCVLWGSWKSRSERHYFINKITHTKKVKKWKECEKLWTSIYQFDPTQQQPSPPHKKKSGWWLTIMKISR